MIIEILEEKRAIRTADVQHRLRARRRDALTAPVIATLATPHIAVADHALEKTHDHDAHLAA